MRRYIKPSADVVELAFSGSIALLAPKDMFTGSVGSTSTDSSVNLFAEPNGAETSGLSIQSILEEDEASK